VLEVRLGLAREAYDDVGGDRGVRHRGPHLVDDAEVALRAVTAAHRLEYRVGARLQRHVQAVTDVRRLGHRGDHIVGEVLRMRAGEPHAFQAVDIATGPQQLAERQPVAEFHTVRVDVLSQQRDLEDALGHQCPYLRQDVARPAVLLLAAQRRNDAERARVVAAHRDRHPAGVGRLAPGGQCGREHLERFEDLHLGGRVVPGPLQQRGQRPDVVRAEHHVHPGRPLNDVAAVLLRQAAADRDLHVRVRQLGRAQVTEVAVEPVVGVLPDRARVEHHDVSRVGVRGPHVSGVLQQTGDALGVVHVHLTAVRADVVRPGGRGGSSHGNTTE
jgi:hypothetical protein